MRSLTTERWCPGTAWQEYRAVVHPTKSAVDKGRSAAAVDRAALGAQAEAVLGAGGGCEDLPGVSDSGAASNLRETLHAPRWATHL